MSTRQPDFQTYLEHTAVRVNTELGRAVGAWRTGVDEQTRGRLSPVLAELAAGVAGGKVLRGTLVQLGYDLTGAAPDPAVLQPAAAYEILHAALLIHDDVIDLSPLRRGRPTTYQALGANHYAVSQALCVGDTGFFLATQLIARSGLSAAVKALVLAEFSQIALDTLAGEMLDVQYSLPGQALTEADVTLIQRLKTAAYTVSGPLVIGALCGSAAESTVAAIRRFGECAGVAFQIQDDILGVFGDESVTGKSVTSDIEENKHTLLITHALAHTIGAEHERLTALYGTRDISPQEYREIQTIFTASGALDYSRTRAAAYIQEAKTIIPEITPDPHYQALLGQFAEFNLSRQK